MKIEHYTYRCYLSHSLMMLDWDTGPLTVTLLLGSTESVKPDDEDTFRI
jgi:hypothetical protein